MYESAFAFQSHGEFLAQHEEDSVSACERVKPPIRELSDRDGGNGREGGEEGHNLINHTKQQSNQNWVK